MTRQTAGDIPRPWTSSEIATLREHAHLGATAVATLLGRSVRAVRLAASRNRISLRRQGERRGIILGQPRAVSWSSQSGAGADSTRLSAIREDALAGVIDLGDLERRALEEMVSRTRSLCPSCGARPQERRSTGLCEPCHLRGLARAHRDEMDRREARRDLWAARQAKHRAGEDES